MPAKISIIKADKYDPQVVYRSIKEGVDHLGGFSRFVKPGQRVLLKPNLLAAKSPEEAVTTHPEVVSAVARHVLDAGGTPFIADSPPLGNWNKIISKTGMKGVALQHGIEITELLNSYEVSRKGGNTFKRLEIAKEVKEADVIVNLPKLKTHSLTRLTLGVKNIFGCVVGKRKAQWHLNAGTDDLFFASMLVELYEEISPDLTIMDGILGMEGTGPTGGNPTKTGLIVSGTDCIALDTVICALVGKKWDYLFTNRVAGERGLGETDLGKIEILGESIESARIEGFLFPKIFETGPFVSVLKKYLQTLFTQKPIEHKKKCTLCGHCIEVCPPAVIKESPRGLEFDYQNCIRCFCCLEVCAEGALTIKDGAGLKFVSRYNSIFKKDNLQSG